MTIAKGRALAVLFVAVGMLSLVAAGSAANRGGTSKSAAPTTLVYAGA